MYQLIEQKKGLDIKKFQKTENYVNFSMLKEFEQPLSFKNFSIKYVVEGKEYYCINQNNYAVNSGEYILANSRCEGKILINSSFVVKGVCIDICQNTLSEVLSNYLQPDAPFPDISLDRFFNTEEFLENRFHSKNTNLGRILSDIGTQLNRNPFAEHKFSNEFYFTLAEKIVEDYKMIFDQIYGIKTIKHQTRKDLFRKLSKGKELIDQNFNEKLNINAVAEYASLSEYHFFRLFKAAFNITPQQYLIKKRLSKASELLQTGNYSVSEVAMATGFSDIYNFSKSFKKHFGTSPCATIVK